MFASSVTCNVCEGAREGGAVLIGLLSGAAPDYLREVGVNHVAAILHTCRPRNQPPGDPRADAEGIPVYAPKHERRLFEHTDLFWVGKQLFDMYNVRNTSFSLTRDVKLPDSFLDFGDW